MSRPNIEPLLARAERQVVASALRAHPEWTLAQLAGQLDGPRGHALANLTVQELLDGDAAELPTFPADGGPPVDQRRLERAQAVNGDEFDALVLEVIAEAPRPVTASYLRARVGGPRWKLQAACKRLAGAGEIIRSGVTSSTQYRIS